MGRAWCYRSEPCDVMRAKVRISRRLVSALVMIGQHITDDLSVPGDARQPHGQVRAQAKSPVVPPLRHSRRDRQVSPLRKLGLPVSASPRVTSWRPDTQSLPNRPTPDHRPPWSMEGCMRTAGRRDYNRSVLPCHLGLAGRVHSVRLQQSRARMT